jgi:tetratricopeptide (TPR) repeat protein
MGKLFISHSSQDDDFVRELRRALSEHGQDGWIDSRELRGGDSLWAEIEQAIEEASAFAVIVSPAGLQSRWVGKELRHALTLQEARGRKEFPVVPLSLDGTRLGVLEEFFGEEPTYLPVTSGAGGVDAAIDPILVALRKREPADVPASPQPAAEPLEDLVLELTDLGFHELDGIRRASARARLVYEPATPGQPYVHSEQSWRLVAPMGPIEAEDLRWYLEKYAIWPSHYFRERAAKVEEDLVEWGRRLHEEAMPVAHAANVLQAWARIGDHAGRRFSVHVDAALEAGAPDEEVATAREAATLLLGLPWELLHDGKRYLFQGAKPTRVRRRLPGTESFDVPVVATPIRILLITARPEDEAWLHRPPRERPAAGRGHGISARAGRDPRAQPAHPAGSARGAGPRPPRAMALPRGPFRRSRCLRSARRPGRALLRRSRGRRQAGRTPARDGLRPRPQPAAPRPPHPLVFLEACQTAQAEKASESVASELLKVGVASVVAMSHSVLVETARRFVAEFYRALAQGRRVGDAMLEGQRALEGDKSRGRIFGTDELRLHDWFVPVLYQEKDDPQLFKTVPARQTREDSQAALAARLGDVPPEPETGFVGRSREMLALQRLLRSGGARFAVVRGQGGEGKTALAAELARWMVRSHQIRRAAFVSVEGLERNVFETVLDKLGDQLVKEGFSTQADCQGDVGKAERQVARALREQPMLLVVDNMESILLPQFLAEETPEALSQESRDELTAILALCERLLKVGETRLIFTSREALPAPFDAERQRRELHRLGREDAVKLVERVVNVEGAAARGHGSQARLLDAQQEAIEQLVDAVHGHARTLALLAPSLRDRGVEATRESLVALMAEMEERFPGSREQSVFASVELSLRRMSEASRERARVLGVFHGGVQLGVLRLMMEWEEADVASLAGDLIETGLATPNRYDHLTLNPALCPYLRAQMDAAERETLTARWVQAMRGYVGLLVQQRDQNTEIAATLTVLELPDLFALLDLVERAGDAEATIGLATSLYGLVQRLGKPRLLERVGQSRDAAVTALGDSWNHARFEAAGTRIEQQLAGGRLREALDGSQQLLERARAAGEHAYRGANHDLAMAINLLGQALHAAGAAEEALALFIEAQAAFEAISTSRDAAERMASVCISRQGDCLRDLGRLDDAAAAYEENIRRAEELDDTRQIAVGKGQLGTVRMLQGRHEEALAALAEARQRFTQLDEPGTVAVTWHQTGLVYQKAGQSEAAEDAYRKSLAIKVRLGNVADQASTLGQLGNLYQYELNRLEEAVPFYWQAVDKYVEIDDAAGEGRVRNNLGAVVAGSRDCALADAPELNYTMAAEILYLIETLEHPPTA